MVVNWLATLVNELARVVSQLVMLVSDLVLLVNTDGGDGQFEWRCEVSLIGIGGQRRGFLYKEQMPRVVRSIDSNIRQRTPTMSKVFEPLNSAALNELAALPPRIIFHVLEEAYGLTADTSISKKQKLKVSAESIRQAQSALIPENVPERKLGFLH